jgi:holo-[acyl-carrier protein] synthase
MNTIKTGSCIVERDRAEKSIKNPKFLSKFFSPQELKYHMKTHFSGDRIVKAFCCKLAFKRAMGCNFNGCKLNEVSVLADVMDDPYISLSGNAKLKFEQANFGCSLSTCSSRHSAMAVVILYSKK